MSFQGWLTIIQDVGVRRRVSLEEYLADAEFESTRNRISVLSGSINTTGVAATHTVNTGKDFYLMAAEVVPVDALGTAQSASIKADVRIASTAIDFIGYNHSGAAAPNQLSDNSGSAVNARAMAAKGAQATAGQVVDINVTAVTGVSATFRFRLVGVEVDAGTSPKIT